MNGTKNRLVGLDSNIFIYHFEENPAFIRYVSFIFEQLSGNKLKGVTSIISIIEALSYPAPPSIRDTIEEGFYTMPNLSIFDVNHDIGVKAADLRRNYEIRLPDAIQLATAIYAKSQTFITNDKRLLKVKNMHIILLSSIL